MRYSIRRLEPADAPMLRALRLRALAGEPTAFGSTLEREEAFPDEVWQARLRPDRNPHFGAIDPSGALVGLAVGTIADDAAVAELLGMWVDPPARGTGLAAQLAECVIGWAQGKGCTNIRLHVTDGNTRAETLYLRLGFARTGRSEIRPRDGMTEVEMHLTKLPAATDIP